MTGEIPGGTGGTPPPRGTPPGRAGGAAGRGSGNDAGRNEINPLDPGSLAAIGCAAEIAGRRIARHLAAVLSGPLEKQGLLAVVTASNVGAVVLAAARQLGNLQFPVSGIVLGSLDYAPEPLREEIKRCRAFRIPLRECQNERDLEFVLRFAGLRLVAVDLQEDINRHSELRDSLLEHPCIDVWSVKETVPAESVPQGVPWYRKQHLAGWDEVSGRTVPGENDAVQGEFQPLLTVADLAAPPAPFSPGIQAPPPEASAARAAADDSRTAPGAPPAMGGRAGTSAVSGYGLLQLDDYLGRHWLPLTRYFAPQPVSRETCRLLDSRAIREFHMTGLRMMELAAFQAAEVAALMARPFVRSSDHRVAVVCGLGNNGGDGFVLARYLACWGFPTDVYIVGDRERILDDALLNLRRLERLRETMEAAAARGVDTATADPKAGVGDLITPGWTRYGPGPAFTPPTGVAAGLELVPITSAAAMSDNAVALQHAVLIVDALLGTGMHGEVRGLNREAIAWMNAAVPPRPGGPASSPPPPPGESEPHVPVLALDTPSGIDASTGEVLGMAVRADVTVTFGAPKIGLSPAAPSPEGLRHAGRVILAEISWPPSRNRKW